MQICSSARRWQPEPCAYLGDAPLSLLKPGWHKHTSTEQGDVFCHQKTFQGQDPSQSSWLAVGLQRCPQLQGTVPTPQFLSSQDSSFPLNNLQLQHLELQHRDNIVFHLQTHLTLPNQPPHPLPTLLYRHGLQLHVWAIEWIGRAKWELATPVSDCCWVTGVANQHLLSWIVLAYSPLYSWDIWIINLENILNVCFIVSFL